MSRQQKNQRKPREIGIYTLDTRDLDISKKTSTPEMNHILKTYGFYTGVYRHKNRRNFHYGKEEMMTGHDLKSMLEQVFRTGSPVPQSSETRQVILHLIKENTRLCLWAMLHFFQIPDRNSLLHNGGNDANLTLKALMMLTLESCKKLDWRAEQEEVKALMMLHAREELPGAKRRRKNEMNKEATIARKEAFRATRIYYWADNDEDEDSCLVFSFENE
ncbi:uncharacterized protein Bfra_007324 [Botrytis fragariae]|uniref:Gfd2/YDR514C-like C-terminal domain-containing protein n=1 Tax=Botrytis fragariae TaxID=1964551 RepID=A0A8H6EDI0_9HELO|nr:uncharacterized protein Bfra_007324 [Botrytis fragariae]KAF5868128.1 hypothetical protein Bfra_007324 [Botrytis fragariae]